MCSHIAAVTRYSILTDNTTDKRRNLSQATTFVFRTIHSWGFCDSNVVVTTDVTSL